MAVTVTPLAQPTNTIPRATSYIADVKATADADTTATCPHGLGVVPQEVIITPLLQASAGLSLWAVTTIDATNVVLTKSTAVGSGNAANQVRVIAKKPHTLTM